MVEVLQLMVVLCTSHTLNNLEESTLYTITVQTATSNNRMSVNSTAVSVTTYTDGK